MTKGNRQGVPPGSFQFNRAEQENVTREDGELWVLKPRGLWAAPGQAAAVSAQAVSVGKSLTVWL